MGRAVALILVGLTLIFGAVGCGDDSDEEFKDRYNEAVQPLSALGDEVVASLTAEGQSDRELATQLDRLADRAEQARGNLAALEPPDDAADKFDELLAALKQSVADLRAVAESAKEGDPVEADEATRALVESGQRLREAEADFQNAVEG